MGHEYPAPRQAALAVFAQSLGASVPKWQKHRLKMDPFREFPGKLKLASHVAGNFERCQQSAPPRIFSGMAGHNQAVIPALREDILHANSPGEMRSRVNE